MLPQVLSRQLPLAALSLGLAFCAFTAPSAGKGLPATFNSPDGKHVYTFYGERRDWDAAEAVCAGQEGGHLASFGDQAEFDFVSRKVLALWRKHYDDITHGEDEKENIVLAGCRYLPDKTSPGGSNWWWADGRPMPPAGSGQFGAPNTPPWHPDEPQNEDWIPCCDLWTGYGTFRGVYMQLPPQHASRLYLDDFICTTKVPFVCKAPAPKPCPKGLRPVKSGAEYNTALEVGVSEYVEDAWTACRHFPMYIESPETFDAAVTPQCTDGKGLYTYKLVTKNPCKAKKKVIGSMTTQTLPKPCNLYIVPQQMDGQVTQYWRNMRPLDCPAGFCKANLGSSADRTIVRQFVREFLLDKKKMKPLMDKIAEGWYCDVGFKRITAWLTSGCIQQQDAEKPGVMAQGRLQFVCYQQARIRTIGVTVNGVYSESCKWNTKINI